MEYKEYFSVIMEQLKEQVGEDSLRFYAKGYRPANKEEKEFVKDTNRRYFNSATGVCLLGDTITVALPKKSSSIESTVRVMPSLNYEEGMPIEKVLNKLSGDIDALLSNEDYTENIELRGTYDYTYDFPARRSNTEYGTILLRRDALLMLYQTERFETDGTYWTI